MRKRVLLHKKIGETPLEALTAWKLAHPAYRNMPAAYAGRLDPMASGKLLILLGDECKKMKKYTSLDKTYELEVLLDIGSDTGDILGVTQLVEAKSHPSSGSLAGALKQQIGTHTVPYPVYSSKTVGGKPLFLYALEGTLDTITIPTHDEVIHSISLKRMYTLSAEELEQKITTLLTHAPTSNEPSKALGANFRIAKVRESWKSIFDSPRSFTVLHLKITCGSGTYMRSLAGRIGSGLGTRALALSITRTRIGKSWFKRLFVV